jgi:hypothetical protein
MPARALEARAPLFSTHAFNAWDKVDDFHPERKGERGHPARLVRDPCRTDLTHLGGCSSSTFLSRSVALFGDER